MGRGRKEGNGCYLSEGAPAASPPAHLRRHLPRPRFALPPPAAAGPPAPPPPVRLPRRGPGEQVLNPAAGARGWGRGGGREEKSALRGGGARSASGGGAGALGRGCASGGAWRGRGERSRTRVAAGTCRGANTTPFVPGLSAAQHRRSAASAHGRGGSRSGGVRGGPGEASDHRVAGPAQFLFLSIPLEPTNPLFRGGAPDPLLCTAPHRGVRPACPSYGRWTNRSDYIVPGGWVLLVVVDFFSLPHFCRLICGMLFSFIAFLK